MREFTIEELSKYRDGDKIYLALGGKVYDVTKSAMFYGPGGAYHVFAGRDASRGLATSDLDPARCLQRPGDISDLDKESLDVLREWIKKFDEKYPVVGRLRTPHSKL